GVSSAILLIAYELLRRGFPRSGLLISFLWPVLREKMFKPLTSGSYSSLRPSRSLLNTCLPLLNTQSLFSWWLRRCIAWRSCVGTCLTLRLLNGLILNLDTGISPGIHISNRRVRLV